jgi:hypothetical protein
MAHSVWSALAELALPLVELPSVERMLEPVARQLSRLQSAATRAIRSYRRSRIAP